MYNTFAHNRNKQTYYILLTLIAVVGIAVSTVLFHKQTKIEKGNDIGVPIDRIEIVDVTSSSLGLFLRTKEQGLPTVYFGSDKKNITTKLIDIRDTKNNELERFNHLYKVDNLNALSDYYIKIVSLKTKTNATQNKIMHVKTSAMIKDTANQPVYGTLVDILNQAVSDVIVLVTVKGSYPLSSITKIDGTFLLSTCCVTDIKKNEYKKIKDSQVVTIEFINDADDTLQIQDIMSNVSPFANAIVYERGTKIINNLAQNSAITPTTLPKQMVLGENSVKKTPLADFEILYPTDIGVIPGNFPLIKGIGIPGKIVTIKVDKNREIKNATVDQNGVWSVTVSNKIPAGTHELTAESIDNVGNATTRTRKFTIGKSGEQVLGSATNSATLTPTVTISPTIVATATATLTPTVPIITPLLPAGSFNLPSLIILSTALILAGLGMILIF